MRQGTTLARRPQAAYARYGLFLGRLDDARALYELVVEDELVEPGELDALRALCP